MTCIKACGLIFEKENAGAVPVPLTGVSVQVCIIDLVAQVNIEQRYVIRETIPIEAVYKFPLDEGAGVCKFSAEVDGWFIDGVVKGTEEAKADYEDAMRTGHTAFLVEEKLQDVFKVHFLPSCKFLLTNFASNRPKLEIFHRAQEPKYALLTSQN